jgi:uncharacterized protein (TIGR03435 family)
MNFEQSLHRKMRQFAEPAQRQVDAARDRVRQRLIGDPSSVYEGFIKLVDRQTSIRHRLSLRLVAVIAVASAVLLAQQIATRWPAQPETIQEKLSSPSVAERRTALPPAAPQETPAAPRPRLEFAAASIRIMPPKTMMTSAGLACHGRDGVKRAVLIITSDAQGAVTAPQGRCVGQGIFLSTLIEIAYGVTPRQLASGTGWAKTSGTVLEFGRGGNFVGLPAQWNGNQIGWFSNESFQIEAVAEDPSTATVAQLQQMLRNMIEDRFQLRFHRERREIPGYSLVVAEGGPKMNPIPGEYVESLVTSNGKSTMEQLARTLSSFLLDEVPVLDKTGLKGAYEYHLALWPPAPGTGPGAGANGGGTLRGGGAPAAEDRAKNLSARMEEQLGLRLQEEKAISVEVLVIDQVERPSPN